MHKIIITLFGILLLISCGDSEQKILDKVFAANNEHCQAIHNPFLGYPSYTQAGSLGEAFGIIQELDTNPLTKYLASFGDEKIQKALENLKTQNADEFTLRQYIFIEECKLLTSKNTQKLSNKERLKKAQESAAKNIADVKENYRLELKKQEELKQQAEQQKIKDEKAAKWLEEDEQETERLMEEYNAKAKGGNLPFKTFYTLPRVTADACANLGGGFAGLVNYLVTKDQVMLYKQRCSELEYPIAAGGLPDVNLSNCAMEKFVKELNVDRSILAAIYSEAEIKAFYQECQKAYGNN